MSGMSSALEKLRSGAMTFADFLVETKGDWRRMAAKLFGRWRLPCGVTEDDVEQEMLLAAWRSAMNPPGKNGGWDPSRGVPLVTHVLWSAHAAAKKWIHTQRKAKRRDDRAPSRHPLSVSSMSIDAEGELGLASLLDVLAWRDPEQESSAEGRAALKLIPATANDPRGVAALEAWLRAGCDASEAARLWYADPKERLRWRLECGEHATTIIRRELARVGHRFEVSFEEGGDHDDGG
jgi:hypothetical protein